MDTPDVGSVEQIRRAHVSAHPKTDNPAWMNSHRDVGVLLDALQSLSLELERVKSERDEAREAADEFMREMSTMADSIEAALARANAAEAEAEAARLREALSRIVAAYDECSGAEPSLSVLFREIDRARPDMEGGKL